MKTLRNHRFVLDVAVFVLLLYGVSAFVYLNGDDFMYASFARTGILKNVCDYYLTGNGRFWINILDSVLLWFDRYAFLILLPWIVLAFVVLLAENIQWIVFGRPDRENERKLIRMGMVLLCCLDVMCLRETVFWITGMMNYLFPATIFLWAYLMFRKSRAEGRCGAGYYLLCFLAASSVEQYALMFVGMMTLHHGWDLIRKKRIPRAEWLAYALSIAGLAVLILAPGNFQRVEEQDSPGLVVNLWSLLYQDMIHDTAVPYVLMLSLIGAWVGRQAGKKLVRVCMQAVPVVILAVVCTPLADSAIYLVIPMAAWLAQMAVLFAVLKKECRPQLLFLCVVGVGSQVMLLISAVWGFRCMLSLYVVYMLLIGCLLCDADDTVRWRVLSCGAAAAIHPLLAAALLGVFLLTGKEWIGKKAAMVCTAISLMILVAGYGANAGTHRENLRRTRDPESRVIVLKELPDDTCSWYLTPFNDFHETYYRILHTIPEDVQIVWEQKAG